jgi:glucosamine-6-phosphate deaminase
MNFNVRVLSSARYADRVATVLKERTDEPGLRLCLPTGSTPKPVYATYAGNGGDLSQTTVFLLDEFGLPPGGPARCDAMLNADLLAKLAAPPARLETWDTETPDLTAECRRMEQAITDGGLDLALLGIGMNGHIGMNEPGSAVDSRSRVVDLHPATVEGAARYGADDEPAWGVTLGLGTLLESRSIWLLVTGLPKAEILAKALKGPETPQVPASYLRRHSSVTVWADEEAASLL